MDDFTTIASIRSGPANCPVLQDSCDKYTAVLDNKIREILFCKLACASPSGVDSPSADLARRLAIATSRGTIAALTTCSRNDGKYLLGNGGESSSTCASNRTESTSCATASKNVTLLYLVDSQRFYCKPIEISTHGGARGTACVNSLAPFVTGYFMR